MVPSKISYVRGNPYWPLKIIITTLDIRTVLLNWTAFVLPYATLASSGLEDAAPKCLELYRNFWRLVRWNMILLRLRQKSFLFTSSLYISDRILVEHNCSKTVSSSFESRQVDTCGCINTFSFISSSTFQVHFIDLSPSLTVTVDHYQRTLIDLLFFCGRFLTDTQL
jgi:hypothetical protein